MKLLYPLSRPHMAFAFSVEKMFRFWPGSVYMWTLTFKHFKTDEQAMYCWNQLATELKNKMPLLRGLRVVEVHPGSVWRPSHGLHFHLLLNQRICKHWLERMGAKWGFGWTWVSKVSKERAMYVGKYLTKAQPELAKGCRRWGGFGDWKYTKTKDVEIDSPFHRNIRKVIDRLKVKRISMDICHTIFVNTKIHGDFDCWPVEGMRYYSRNAESILSTLPRGNKYHVNKDIAMQVRAVRWAKQSYREANRRKPAAGEKNFYRLPPGHPRAYTGESPVKNQDRTLDTTDYVLDKIPRKWVGMALANKKVYERNENSDVAPGQQSIGA